MSRQDPKPGRWILPLVVLGIVGFTYVFVNALPPADVTATTLAPGATVAPPTTPAPTTTTIDPAVAAFLAEIDRIEQEGADLINEAQEINDAWDNGDLSFSAARQAFTDYTEKVADFAADVTAVTVPPSASDAWTEVTAAADAMAVAADAMLEGFLDPNSSAGRRDAHEALKEAGTELATALDGARAAG